MKTVTTITIDTNILSEVRLRKINLSGKVNELLKTYLNVQEPVNLSELERQAIEEQKARLSTEIITLNEKLSMIKAQEEAKSKEEGEWTSL